jgi:hypothetical protein
MIIKKKKKNDDKKTNKTWNKEWIWVKGNMIGSLEI